jgi:sulfhydrogenase subunit delta
MIKKLKVGIYAITGCYGCLLSVIYNEKELLDLIKLIDIKAFPFIKKKQEKVDIILLEGTVAEKDDLETLKKLREKTKILVALGACSCTGGVPAYRNFIDYSNYKNLEFRRISPLRDTPATPIDKYVNIDYYLPGCPPDKNEVLTFIKNMCLGKEFKTYDKAVCVECRFNRNKCLLDENKLCLGPITRGNCNSICTNGNLECWGCRGPISDANYDTMIKLLEQKGFSTDYIKERMKTFVGLKIKDKEIC